MAFEWDENQRHQNVVRHRLDLVDAQDLFDGRPTIVIPSPRHGKIRFVAVGLIEDKFHAVVWTHSGDVTRLILFRRARDAEVRAYRAHFR
jgi:uncharacterized DUF497 family protein